MIGRRLSFIVAMVALASSAPASENLAWNGVWTGTFGNASKISVTIAGKKVTNYSYRGARLDVSYNDFADDTLSFGDGNNYAMSLKRTGADTANATYHGRHGFAVAPLKRQ
jgi:hypothetical protein